MGSEDAVMRAKIHHVLVKLTGRTWPPAPVMWRKWWEAEGALYKLPTREAAAQSVADFKADRATANAGGTVSSFFGVPVISHRVLFIIDVSGSMGAEHVVRGQSYDTGMKGTRLAVAKTQLLRALDALPNGDRFNVMFFHTTHELWSDGLAKLGKSNRRSAQGFINEQEPRGGTALYDALERIFLDFDIDVDTIYVLSDGQPSGGTENRPERIREAVNEWNRLRHITIHSISIGGSIGLLQQLAEDSGGVFREVK
jgi:Mg-chelatase subunit ChlD